MDQKMKLATVTQMADVEKIQGMVIKVTTAARPSPDNLIHYCGG